MISLSLPSVNSGNKVQLDLKNPVIFLSHVSTTVGVLFFLLFLTHFTFYGGSFFSFPPSVSVSLLVCLSLVFLAATYAFFLLSGKNIRLSKNYLIQGLFAFTLTLILYVYGEQDRFLLNDNPAEDLADFGFILFLVVCFWMIISFVFGFSKSNFKHINKPAFLITRGILLLFLIIPLDVLFNHFYLKMAYGLPLYEDYWVLEIPLKITLILFINFLEEVNLISRISSYRPTSMKVKSGNQYRFIEFDTIAYFMVQNQTSYLYTTEGKKFMVDQPLSKLEKDFHSRDFFRAGRQLLVSRKSVRGYKSAQGKKIELSLVSHRGFPEKFVISRLTAPDFRRWIKTKTGTTQL